MAVGLLRPVLVSALGNIVPTNFASDSWQKQEVLLAYFNLAV